MSVVVEAVGPAAAAEVLAVVHAAFRDRPPLDPPTDALAETEESIAARLEPAGGLLARADGRPVGAVVLDPKPDEGALYLRRFGIVPDAQGMGVARKLVREAVHYAQRNDLARVAVLAREELPATIGFWKGMGFCEVEVTSPYLRMEHLTPWQVTVPTADDMRTLAASVAPALRPGDVLVLAGELGAGKTTFTQGLGEGLQVRGGVTSPTFVISRVHPGLDGGPALVHVDAYRLGGSAELDDLDLDADLDEAITVVEWGHGVAEALTDSPLEIRIERALAATDVEDGDDPRVVTIEPVGPGWVDRTLPIIRPDYA
ncbi:MAG: tRNA (adenosine(37)-N6)-threonylcarbamoyltransferase complex ATPase subunit type 1 TsaE [Nocardioidaceae bacterium]|nr:tRNA (adenosine(37)-N6)-threonylcarbamoyltransferase complex ATPase subunit type 1 TsaE [Nocardioidaceae bacterium]